MAEIKDYWRDSDIYKKVEGKSLWTRFVGWLNNFLNPSHDWVDYSTYEDSGFGASMANFEKSQMHSGLTREEIERNQMNLQNEHDVWQQRVTGMKDAGLNTALMYGSSAGSGSAPQSSAPQSGMNMSDLMQALMLPAQLKIMNAQAKNIGADTSLKDAQADESRVRTENVALINAYYPQKQEAELDKLLAEIGVDLSTIGKNDAETALKNMQTLLSEKENRYADAFFKARADYEAAKTDESKASAAAAMARAAMDGYELEFSKKNGYNLSSSSIMAIVSALGSITGLDAPETRQAVKSTVQEVIEDNTRPFGMYKRAGQKAKEYVRKNHPRAYDRLRDFRNSFR